MNLPPDSKTPNLKFGIVYSTAEKNLYFYDAGGPIGMPIHIDLSKRRK
jgi:hypothetical protein